MNRSRPPSPAAAALVAALAAVTSWAAMLSWRPLAADAGWTVLLLIGCLMVGAVGASGRLLGAPRLVVAGLQVTVATMLLLTWSNGSPVPSPAGFDALAAQVRAGADAAMQYTVPVPETEPVTSLFLLAGLATAIVVDLTAVGWSRVGLAGVVLLAVHVVPANLEVTPSWVQFAVVALGFLALLHLVQVEAFTRWDNATTGPGGTPEGASREGAAGAVQGREGGSGQDDARYASTPAALTIAVAAVALATVAGAVVPRTGFAVWDGPGGGDGSNGVAISNPLVDLRRDLSRGWDMPLVRVTGESPRRPTYVRLATLTSFNGREWSSGNRTAPATQAANGLLPEPVGVDEDVPRQTFQWRYTASQAFESRWLPTPLQVAGVDAPGDWRYDLDSRDFVAWEKGLNTSGLTWDSTELVLDLDGSRLDDAPDGRRSVDSDYTDLPDSLPPMVEDLATEVAGEESSPFRQARALQAWFRSEFTYSLDQVESVGNDDLVDFLEPEGREGYCEQFAAAMAVMARSLGIPARVVVGFLSPEKVATSTWVFSAHDLHAWPELYFPGSGWVRFEPTPASRTSGAPSYSTADLPQVEEPTSAPSSSASVDPRAERPRDERPDDERAQEPVEQDDPFPWRQVLTTFLLLLAAAAVAATPRAVRSRRRARRLDSTDPEQWWTELRDTAVDLGLAWPRGRSVRVAGAWLAGRVGCPWPRDEAGHPDPASGEEPTVDERGGEAGEAGEDERDGWRSVSPAGSVALTRTRPLGSQDAASRLVGALERRRYGTAARQDDDLRADAVWLRAELLRRASRSRRAAATWLPRSLWP